MGFYNFLVNEIVRDIESVSVLIDQDSEKAVDVFYLSLNTFRKQFDGIFDLKGPGEEYHDSGEYIAEYAPDSKEADSHKTEKTGNGYPDIL